jgi:AhpD family alkylhydroperoxidase
MENDIISEEINARNMIEKFQHEMENKFSSGFKDVFEKGFEKEDETFFTNYNNDYNCVFEDNKLLAKTKVLIALAVASGIYRPYCIDLFCNEAKEQGWTDEQIEEVMRVASAVRCGFVITHAVHEINKLERERI